MDVFLEMASHLHPLDILHLCRVSKWFRAIFLNKRHRFVWVSAIRKVSYLPDCPPCLSEPRFVAVVFGRHCFGCGIGKSTEARYVLGLRYCRGCLSASTASSAGFEHLRSFSIAEFNAVLMCYHLSEQDASSRESFINERKVIASQMKQFDSDMRSWDAATQELKFAERRRAAANRRASIEANLKKLGYSRQEFPHRDKLWKKLVNQSKELTPRIWDRIRPLLEAKIQAQRDQEMDKYISLRRAKIQNHYRTLPMIIDPSNSAIVPNETDFLLLPSISTFTSRNQVYLASTHDRFMAYHDSIMKDIAQFRLTVKRDLVAILRADPLFGREEHPESELDAVLSRPSSLFGCFLCINNFGMSTVGYPAIYHHWMIAHSDRSWSAEVSLSPENPISHIFTQSTSANTMVKALHLPEDTSIIVLDDMVRTGRLACQCGDPLLPPASSWSWGGLVAHITTENLWYQNMLEGMDSDRGAALILHNDHDLNSDSPCIKVLHGGEAKANSHTEHEQTMFYSAVTHVISGMKTPGCGICLRMIEPGLQLDPMYKPYLTRDAHAIAHHMQAKHLKDLGSVLENLVFLD
ncbi:hypothetical protein A0H81_06913 [Grifola frondosa]|uniref:F-box domain-containing protein n=1 Tax=Grifola frondosa TaxID=5627 RepID=A0A1C7MDT3_GRIFR|nr:hypothetical protein A0H81_06913 [Grifola frondosa]